MKRCSFVFILFVCSPVPIYAQHYQWIIVTTSGSEFDHVHPDTIRADSLALSDAEGKVFWFPLDSIQALVYNHNPAMLPLALMGGVVGALNYNNTIDSDWLNRIKFPGMLIGSAVGAAFAQVFGNVHEEVVLAGLDFESKWETIRKTVARRTGRVIILK